MPVELNRDKCPTCPDRPCITTWKHPSFEPVEFEQSTAGLIEKASRYKPLMAGGGVTFGGGEPTIQMDELCEILPELRARGIHTAVETNASHPTLPRLFGMADLLICDLKCISMELHRIWTGHENDSVLKNLRAAVKSGIPLLVRVTLVPGFNDGYEEISIISGFLAELKQLRGTLSVEILKFHHLGRPKYLALGLDYPMEGACQNLETAGELINLLANSGIHA
jgi:pyruvate formate lyase activating enzyme